jgi:hypothetical protein
MNISIHTPSIARAARFLETYDNIMSTDLSKFSPEKRRMLDEVKRDSYDRFFALADRQTIGDLGQFAISAVNRVALDQEDRANDIQNRMSKRRAAEAERELVLVAQMEAAAA